MKSSKPLIIMHKDTADIRGTYSRKYNRLRGIRKKTTRTHAAVVKGNLPIKNEQYLKTNHTWYEYQRACLPFFVHVPRDLYEYTQKIWYRRTRTPKHKPASASKEAYIYPCLVASFLVPHGVRRRRCCCAELAAVGSCRPRSCWLHYMCRCRHRPRSGAHRSPQIVAALQGRASRARCAHGPSGECRFCASALNPLLVAGGRYLSGCGMCESLLWGIMPIQNHCSICHV